MKNKQIYITEKELAERWSISNFTLQRWRFDGRSLPYFKIGKQIRYSLELIEKFEAQNISTATTNNTNNTNNINNIWELNSDSRNIL